jgi:hypothetical protein
MKTRDIVLDTIHHRQPECFPYTLSFEGEVERRLNDY